MRIVPAPDIEAPELAVYRSLRRPEEHHRSGIFVAEGLLPVSRLLQSDLEVVSLLCSQRWLDRLDSTRLGEGTTVFVAPETVLNQVVGFRLHQGVMAVAKCPQEPEWDSLVGLGGLLVALDGLNQPDNVGTIVRSAAALGASGIIASETCCSPWMRRAVRNSMGAVYSCPIRHSPNLADDLSRLAASGYEVAVADEAGDQPAWLARLPKATCMVLGNEHDGASDAVRRQCRQHVSIPMQRGIDSINVGAAAAVLFYEWQRRNS